MAQHSKVVQFGAWTKLNDAPGGEFRAFNDTTYDLALFYSAAAPVEPITGPDLTASWRLPAGGYAQRVPEAGTMDCYATLKEIPAGPNSSSSVTVSVVEP